VALISWTTDGVERFRSDRASRFQGGIETQPTGLRVNGSGFTPAPMWNTFRFLLAPPFAVTPKLNHPFADCLHFAATRRRQRWTFNPEMDAFYHDLGLA